MLRNFSIDGRIWTHHKCRYVLLVQKAQATLWNFVYKGSLQFFVLNNKKILEMCSQTPKYLFTTPSHKNLRHALVPPLYINKVWIWWIFMLQSLLSIVWLKMSMWIINCFFHFRVTNAEYSVGNVISNNFFLLQRLLVLPLVWTLKNNLGQSYLSVIVLFTFLVLRNWQNLSIVIWGRSQHDSPSPSAPSPQLS